MKKSKFILALLLCFMVAIVLPSCGDGNSKKSDGGEKAGATSEASADQSVSEQATTASTAAKTKKAKKTTAKKKKDTKTAKKNSNKKDEKSADTEATESGSGTSKATAKGSSQKSSGTESSSGTDKTKVKPKKKVTAKKNDGGTKAKKATETKKKTKTNKTGGTIGKKPAGKVLTVKTKKQTIYYTKSQLKKLGTVSYRYSYRNKKSSERQFGTYSGIKFSTLMKKAGISGGKIYISASDGYTNTYSVSQLKSSKWAFKRKTGTSGKRVPAIITLSEEGAYRLCFGQDKDDTDDAGDYNMQDWAKYIDSIEAI